jgi:hypothetical protein
LFWEREESEVTSKSDTYRQHTQGLSLPGRLEQDLEQGGAIHFLSLLLPASSEERERQEKAGRGDRQTSGSETKETRQGEERFSQQSRRLLPSELTASLLCCPSPSSFTI